MKPSFTSTVSSGISRSNGFAPSEYSTTTALLLAKEGAAVVVAARTTSDLESLVQEIEAAGGKALAVTTDVSIEEQAESLVKQTLDAYGRVLNM